ncbi:MAG: methylmalonyl-CoA mutase [Acidobacteria bacterium]|nr:methylmalonyl-CoA mutase [Acidobacteriota bacterium]
MPFCQGVAATFWSESQYNRAVPDARTPDDLAGWQPEAALGEPGEFPFTRGIQPTMYRGRPWTMRQYAGFATAAESNARYRYLLAQGVNGLSVAFDLPTQMGYDSDHALAAGEVGRVGVAIDSIDDMAALFEAIPLDRVSTSMTINATAIILLSLYMSVARRQGVSLRALSGTIQNDILKEYVARGTYIFPPRQSLRLVTDIFAFCERELPNWNTISISGYHIREAGSTAIQEVAFTLAHAIAYVQAAIDAGLDVNQVGQRLSFFFNAHNDFLEEIAKYRAARRLWARLMRDRFHATSPRAQQLRFHTQTAGSTLTAQQSDNNIVRVALQALAAVLGGTQSLHCNGRDEALALPTEESARIALRTQQIVAAETGVANTVDPVAGSYTIETLTNQIEEGAADILARIDRAGGTLAAIETGFIQREIQESAYRAQVAIDAGDTIVVGVNRFAENGTGILSAPTGSGKASRLLFAIDPDIERTQIERVRAVRAGRNAGACRAALAAVTAAARGDGNLVPPIVTAVEARATVGEVADALRAVFGEYRETAAV